MTDQTETQTGRYTCTALFVPAEELLDDLEREAQDDAALQEGGLTAGGAGV